MHSNIVFKEISYKEAIDFILPKHYSGRKPVVSYSFGLFENNELKSVCTFGKPASNSLCKGVCGDYFSSNVYELNRLCTTGSSKPLSWFVARCLNSLKKHNIIVVSYADTAMNHNGYIYQACNFIYTGATAKRTDKYTDGNKHSRHYNKCDTELRRKVRSSKHRYIYFAMSCKYLKKKALNNLNYDIKDYPKGDNKRYTLGDYLEVEIVNGKKDKANE